MQWTLDHPYSFWQPIKYRNLNIQESKIIIVNPKFASRLVNTINQCLNDSGPTIINICSLHHVVITRGQMHNTHGMNAHWLCSSFWARSLLGAVSHHATDCASLWHPTCLLGLLLLLPQAGKPAHKLKQTFINRLYFIYRAGALHQNCEEADVTLIASLHSRTQRGH